MNGHFLLSVLECPSRSTPQCKPESAWEAGEERAVQGDAVHGRLSGGE